MIQRLTRSRGIRHNRRPASLTRRVRAGDVIEARIGGTEQNALKPLPMALVVMYEDDDLLLIDKPAGTLVHPTSSDHTVTLAHGVAQ